MGALAPLRAKAEQQGNTDFTPFWSGQASPLGREMPARELTFKLVQEAVDRLKQLSQTVEKGDSALGLIQAIPCPAPRAVYLLTTSALRLLLDLLVSCRNR
jgi:hypothetical protein